MTGQGASRVTYSEQDVSRLSDLDGRLVLTENGIPRDHLLFGANETLRQEMTANGRLGLLIGEVGDGDGLFVDTASGEVFTVGANSGEEWHVNRTLRQFVESLGIFQDAYPFYLSNSTVEVREDAVSRLRTRLAAIDQTSIRDDPGFWNTVLFDVGVGDYADEMS